MRFGQLLKRSRKAKGVTLREVADMCGLSIGYLSDIEHGRKNPPEIRTVGTIERFLEVEDGCLTNSAVREAKFPVEAKRIIQKRPETVMALLRISEDMAEDELEKWIDEMKRERGGK